jgi:hypothetical protein
MNEKIEISEELADKEAAIIIERLKKSGFEKLVFEEIRRIESGAEKKPTVEEATKHFGKVMILLHEIYHYGAFSPIYERSKPFLAGLFSNLLGQISFQPENRKENIIIPSNLLAHIMKKIQTYYNTLIERAQSVQ